MFSQKVSYHLKFNVPFVSDGIASVEVERYAHIPQRRKVAWPSASTTSTKLRACSQAIPFSETLTLARHLLKDADQAYQVCARLP